MPAGNRRSIIAQRTKNIMSLVDHGKGENLELDDEPKDKSKTSSLKKRYTEINSSPTRKLQTETSSVDNLYTREYSMTSEVFQTFCETQTTLTSHHFNNLSNIINTVKDSYLLNDSQSEVDTQKQVSLLFCEETMPIDSPMLDKPVTSKTKQDVLCHESMPKDSAGKICQSTLTETLVTPALHSKPASRVTRQSTLNYTLSPSKSNDDDFGSDDSVLDKNYIPTEDDSSDDENTQNSKPVKKCLKTETAKKIAQKKATSLRRNTIETSTSNFADKKPLKRRRMTIASTVCSAVSLDTSNNLDNPPPKRIKYSTSLSQRKLEKRNQRLLNFQIKDGCDNKCGKKCSNIMTIDERKEINRKFWNMTRSEQRIYVRAHYTVAIPKRKYTNEPKRNPKRCFNLQKSDGTLVTVCKIFFLTTLGFDKKNDKILKGCLDTENDVDKRGKHIKTPKVDREIITNHIESFKPSAPHYRREHAPNRRYLPNEININFMYKDFCKKHPDTEIGYELYRTHLKAMNISFTRLGNEECSLCESYKLHTEDVKHDAKKDIVIDCKNCTEWAAHRDKYTKARQLYDSHKFLEQNQQEIYYSSDLEKVIMLPRLETFKDVIFCPRLTAYNQSFAPVGKITKDSKPLAAIWHDGIAGRKQEDIMSAYFNFFLRFRDVKTIHIWMDNCTAQNKNWLFYSMLADIVNSEVVSTERIILYYFEPGHTFMSCDQFHHQVELSMKKKNKIYDFIDFEDAVASTNNGKVIVKSMQPQDFINYPNNVSERRIQNSNPRPYLSNMSEVCFMRSSFDLRYKNHFDEDYKVLKFLNDKFLNNPQFAVTFRSLPSGIDKTRKENIIKKLSPIIPKHKMIFWQNLPICNDSDTENVTKNNKKRATR